MPGLSVVGTLKGVDRAVIERFVARMEFLAEEEKLTSSAECERLEDELKILLLPKDPNDSKNVIIEIRAGAGGEEAALFAADIYRMYSMYATANRFKIEVNNLNDTVADNNNPNSNWWLFRWYADMEGYLLDSKIIDITHADFENAIKYCEELVSIDVKNITGKTLENVEVNLMLPSLVKFNEWSEKYNVDDISFETKTMHIDKTMQRIQNFKGAKNKTDIIISSPKSEFSIREIPVPQFIIDLIIKNDLYKRDAYLLTGEVAKFIEPRTLENKFNKIATICNIENVTFHMIRHTFASNCIEAGVDVKSLSEILGHSSVNITLKKLKIILKSNKSIKS